MVVFMVVVVVVVVVVAVAVVVVMVVVVVVAMKLFNKWRYMIECSTALIIGISSMIWYSRHQS